MPFQKGHKGIAGTSVAKQKKIKQIRELLAKHVPEAVDAVAKALQDPDTQLAAAKEVFDRVYGKSAQSIDIGGEGGRAMAAILEIVAKDSK